MTFGDISDEYSNYRDSKIVLLPVPYDETSTWNKGADKGPAAIIEASPIMELYDIETASEPYKVGIHILPEISDMTTPERMVESVYTETKKHLGNGKLVVTLGGEHSVSIGAIRAYAGKFPGMCVLQIDAHADMRPDYLGSKYNHACVMHRVKEMCPIVQVGIRSMDVDEKEFTDPKRIYFAHDIFTRKTPWIPEIIELLDDQVYITIDLDALDPSIMPSTGTPEPGGFGYYGVLELVRTVIASRKVVGFDIVELCPNDIDKAPDFLACKLFYKMLAYKFFGPGKKFLDK
jgi:agmatinase